MWEEKVIFRDSAQQNFVICFCDILADQANYHRKCYGDIAIVLTKDWGIRNNISPVRYVHKSSVGQFPEYIKIKNINREVRELNLDPKDRYRYTVDYLCMGLAKDNGYMKYPSISQSIAANAALDDFFEAFENEFEDVVDDLRGSGKDKLLLKYFTCIGNRLLELHNELENRDAFMRVYQDDFKSPATGETINDKVLYDEREWRSVKFIGDSDFQKDPSEYTSAIKNRYLPERFNLKFNSSDLKALLITEKSQIDDLTSFIKLNKTLLDPTIDLVKIKLFDDFKE